jgi:diguanylate cyclase (GGDEF)-like protein
MNQPSALSLVLEHADQHRDVFTGALAPSTFREAVAAWTTDAAVRQLPSSSLLLVRVDSTERPGRTEAAEALRSVTELIGRGLRSNDVVGRIDHETVGVLLPTTNTHQAEIVARRMVAAVAGRTVTQQRPLTVSIGIASALAENPWAQAGAALADAQERGGDHAVLAIDGPDGGFELAA